MAQVTMVEFRGCKKDCLTLDERWSEADIIKLFKRSGYELPPTNITGRWILSESNLEDYPEGRKITVRLNNSDKLPTNKTMLQYITNIVKASPSEKY